MKSIIFITPQDAEYGFSLAGVNQLITSVKETEDVLRRVMAESEAVIMVVDERLLKGIDGKKLSDIEERWHGIFLILPAPEKEVEMEDTAVRLIKRAIGYHLRLVK